jgi:choline dehydrogenase-like flavoprotein
MQTTQFDAIVIGSGITGGWAAKELTGKGLKVLVLERGKELRHSIDYTGEHAPNWKLPYQGKRPRDLYEKDYFVQQKSYAFSEANRHMFNNDRLNPYISNPDKPFRWVRADVVGGRSLLWGRQSYRWSEQDFEANRVDGHGIPWPIGYKDLAPWYSYVEKFIGVSGQAEGLPQLPDSEFLPPMGYHAVEKTIKERLAKKAPDIKVTMGRTAVLTQDHNGRSACHYCGPCHNGCSTGSYFSSQSSTLPAATATGNLTLKANAVVDKLVYDPDLKRVVSVEVIDSQTRERSSYSARIFFVCASTLGSSQVLLNSTSASFPHGLANSSGAVGRYLMDHVNTIGGLGIFLDNMDSYYHGNRPNNLYIPRFRNLPGQEDDTDYVRGFGYQAVPIRADWSMGLNSKGFGADYKNSLSKPGFWMFALGAFGECLPQQSNRVFLDRSKPDRFGIPQVSIEFEWSENELAIVRDFSKQGDRLMKAAGAVYSLDLASDDPEAEVVGGGAVHEMGTARMGDDPTQSVLNGHNQAHDIPNLFVTDGSCMTSTSCVNPSLTYMALTARACDYAVNQMAAGQI